MRPASGIPNLSTSRRVAFRNEAMDLTVVYILVVVEFALLLFATSVVVFMRHPTDARC